VKHAKRLFSAFVPPDALYEHPIDYPLNIKAIPLGEMTGWECLAPANRGDSRVIVGPFTPTVINLYGRKAIISPSDSDGRYGDYGYYYGTEGVGRPNRPCWYQSCCTLRFVKKFIVWNDTPDFAVFYYGVQEDLIKLRGYITSYNATAGDLEEVFPGRWRFRATLPNAKSDREVVWDARNHLKVTWAEANQTPSLVEQLLATEEE
jgi:hypothetical protein